ncbi:MAG TPA: helix-turn-helix transcriptional regulator [Micromonospora sp.]
MANDSGSTVPRRQLGRYLRQLREQARIMVKDAADMLEVSPQKLWRIETGRGHERIRSVEVETMCKLYDAPAELTGALVALARETKAKGWWQAYGEVIPTWFELYVGLEAAATRIRKYEAELVPGLLQTRGYAEAMFRTYRPDIGDDELQRAVGVRMERQALLARELPAAPALEVVLSEVVLRRPIRDPAAMATQCRALLAAAEVPHISLRVLPMAVGPTRASLSGPFTILEFPPGVAGAAGEPTTIYSESLTGALYLDRPQEVAVYESVWSELTGHALDEAESQKVITSVIGEMSTWRI